MSNIPEETIEIHDLPSLLGNTSNSIIVIDGDEDNSIKESGSCVLSHEAQDIFYHKNKQLSKIVELCLKLEYSTGMSRIVNNILLKSYNEADPEYMESERFKKFLKKIIYRLQTDPDHKFYHMKTLCDHLKLHKYKKRVKLVTLTKCLDTTNGHLNGNNFIGNNLKRQHSPVNIISKRQKSDIIDLDDEQDAVIDLDGAECLDMETNLSDQYNIEYNFNIQSIQNDNANLLIGETMSEVSYNHLSENNSNEVENQYLVPIERSNVETPVYINDTTVKQIENEIAHCKNQISLLDEEEVVSDTAYSPYIRSEKYKARIVELYKKLCEITGDEPVKRCQIRLQVVPGRPVGPVKYLEEFLNDNIRENGEPPFPDFQDVVLCVAKANHSDNLGWTAVQIMNEANALFTQCGRWLQKRRQRRAWLDMLSRVKADDIQDPADEDPELLARLEENKRIARKKEEDVIEMFTSLEHETKAATAQGKLLKNKRVSCNDSENKESNCVGLEHQNVKSSDADKRVNNFVVENENTEVNLSRIKDEPLDISSILDELGDDFSATVIEVLDPFMVIEIPSESEDEDEKNNQIRLFCVK